MIFVRQGWLWNWVALTILFYHISEFVHKVHIHLMVIFLLHRLHTGVRMVMPFLSYILLKLLAVIHLRFRISLAFYGSVYSGSLHLGRQESLKGHVFELAIWFVLLRAIETLSKEITQLDFFVDELLFMILNIDEFLLLGVSVLNYRLFSKRLITLHILVIKHFPILVKYRALDRSVQVFFEVEFLLIQLLFKFIEDGFVFERGSHICRWWYLNHKILFVPNYNFFKNILVHFRVFFFWTWYFYLKFILFAQTHLFTDDVGCLLRILWTDSLFRR